MPGRQLLVLPAVLLLAACGSAGEPSGGPTQGSSPGDGPTAASPASPGPSSPAPGEPTGLGAPADDTWSPWSKGGTAPTDLTGDGTAGFTAADGAVGCLFDRTGGTASVRCDRTEGLGVDQPQPADCDGRWGDAVSTSTKGRTTLVCASPTDDVVGRAAATGRDLRGSVRYDGLTCTARDDAVQCLGPGARGFVVSTRVVVTR